MIIYVYDRCVNITYMSCVYQYISATVPSARRASLIRVGFWFISGFWFKLFADFWKIGGCGFGGWFQVFILGMHTLILNPLATSGLHVSRFENSVEKTVPKRKPMGTQMDAN